MKKFNLFFVLMFILVLISSPMFACATEKPDPAPTPTTQVQNQSQYQGQSQFLVNGPVTNTNTNLNTNNNILDPTTKSKADSSANSLATGNGVVDTNIQYNNPRQTMAAPTTFSEPIPLLANGSVGDITEAMPAFRGIKKLQKTDVITSILGVFKGNLFSRIRYEDIEMEVLSDYAKVTASDPASIRYTVKFKGSVQGVGTSGGLSGALGGVSSIASASLLPGINRSTYDPMFFITFYTVVSKLE